MKTLIIGANGKIGRLLCEQCAQRDIPIKAMVRKEEQLSFFNKLGVETVVADLEKNFEYAFKDCQRVVFTAGSGSHTGGDKTILVDLYGAILAINNSLENKIEHFIMISAVGAANPLAGPETIKHYLVAKKLADDHLIKSSLNYTILRPTRLTNDPGSGKINTSPSNQSSRGQISRENVAESIILCFNNSKTYHKVINLYDGDIPISEALVKNV